MIVQTIKTTPRWVGENWKTILSLIGTVWTVVVFMSGWFTGVNATVEDFPKVKVLVLEHDKKIDSFDSKFNMFMDMYRLEILGRHSEAREIAKDMPTNKP